jgi:hypothetical protein
MRKLQEIPRVQEWINLVIGAVLFSAPWVLQFTDLSEATSNARICGFVICVVSIGALLAYGAWEEWHGIALGAWIIVSPWALDFAPVITALGAHVILGVLLIASESWEIWTVRHPHLTA